MAWAAVLPLCLVTETSSFGEWCCGCRIGGGGGGGGAGDGLGCVRCVVN